MTDRIITMEDIKEWGACVDGMAYALSVYGTNGQDTYRNIHARLMRDDQQSHAYWLYRHLPDKTDADHAVMFGDKWPKLRDFLAAIKSIPWLDNHGPEPVGDDIRMYDTRGAARGASWGASWGAAWDAAWDAALVAARDAAWGAARGASWGAARGAAWVAARGAARDAARDAALVAALSAALIICDDLPIPQQHVDHVRRRWAVWQAGYGVLCDVDGVLYCYRAEKK